MQDPERLLASYENIDHRLVPESVVAATDDDYPILSEVEGLEDRYEIIEEIARGGQKQVCVAHDRVTDRRVALATLHGSAAAAESEAFLREARLHASLVHPNVVRVYDLGVLPDNRAFFTMTLMTGRTLADLIADETPLAELLEVFLRVCDGIAYAHSRSVLHLDLKPANIQVGQFGDVFVSDWGIAKIGEQQAANMDEPSGATLDPDMLNHFTLSGTIKGTPGYMAPEQANGTGTSLATDVYGLGALLYAILASAPVCEGNTTEQILSRTKVGDFPTPVQRASRQDIPPALSAVCMRALSTRPEDRYADVNALRSEIDRYRAGFATVAEDASFADHARLLLLRHKAPVALITVFLITLVVSTGLFVQRLSRSQSEALQARDRAEHAEDAALTARDHAVEAVKALQIARREQAQLAALFSSQLLEDGRRIYSDELGSKGAQHRFAAAKEKIDAALVQTPNDPGVLLQKGLIEFILQNFQEANLALAASGAADFDDLTRFTAKLAAEQIAESRSVKELTIHALETLSEQRDTLARYLYLNAAATPEYPDRPDYVKVMLRRENPGLERLSFTYKINEAYPTLDLSSNPELRTIEFAILEHDQCILYRLNIRELDLSDTNVAAIKSLRHVKLIRLNIAGAPISDLNLLADLPMLAHLVVDEGQRERLKTANLSTNVVIETRPASSK